MKITHSLVTDARSVNTDKQDLYTRHSIFFISSRMPKKYVPLSFHNFILCDCGLKQLLLNLEKVHSLPESRAGVDTCKNLLCIQEPYNIWQWRPAPYSKTRKSPLQQCSIMIYINESSLSNMWQKAVRNTICSGRVCFQKPTRNITSHIQYYLSYLE